MLANIGACHFSKVRGCSGIKASKPVDTESAELELITKSRSSKHEAVVGSGRKEANDDNDMQRQRE